MIVIGVIAVLGYMAYRTAFIFVGDNAMNALVKSEIEEMLDTGEIGVSELEAMLSEDEADEADVPDSGSENESDEIQPSGKQTQSSSSQQKSAAKKEVEETVKKVSEKVTGNISDADKIAMTRLITSRLSGGDIRYLMGLAGGGLTGEEISAAYRLAKSRFSASELSEIKVYWHRYKNSLIAKK